MRKIKLEAVLIALLALVGFSAAHGGTHEGLPEPGHLPGSMMYPIDKLSESIDIALTLSEEKKMEKKLKFAEERLSESIELVRQNRTEKASELASKYSSQIENVKKKARQRGMEEVREKADSRVNQSMEVLRDLEEQLPEQAELGMVREVEEKEGENESKDQGVNQRGYIATGKVVGPE